MANKYFYITTTLPYVNAQPHIGFGMEIVTADVLARFHRLNGEKVIFNTGTDEHGQKIYQQANKNHQSPQEYADESVKDFIKLKHLLNLSFTHFIRTSDLNHISAAQRFWQICHKNGDIYLDHYQVKYCVGCELPKQDSDLDHGKCPLHPNQNLELRDEENYFFRFSKYQDQLLKIYQDQPEFVKPAGKLKEIETFVKSGIKDFSISRLKTKMPWGVPVPNDQNHVMYVWFDALVNYISTLGWPKDIANFQAFWPGVQIAGKDNLRQQAAMWQAMLLSAGLKPSRQILINGFISVAGQKMSKSLGNVITPEQMVERYGQDATRWLLMNLGPIGSDIDVSWQQFDQTYTAQLANGLGNLCSRVAQLVYKAQLSKPAWHAFNTAKQNALNIKFNQYLENSEINSALDWINQQIVSLDHTLSQKRPWLLSPEAQKPILTDAVNQLITIAMHLVIFMPKTAENITKYFQNPTATKLEPLFPRL